MNSQNMPQLHREISIGLFSAQLASTDLVRGSGRFLAMTRHILHLKMTVLTGASLIDPINIERDS
jgi:hypothetical protein